MTLYKLSSIEHETVIIRYHFHPIKCISAVCSNSVTNYYLICLTVLCQVLMSNKLNHIES